MWWKSSSCPKMDKLNSDEEYSGAMAYPNFVRLNMEITLIIFYIQTPSYLPIICAHLQNLNLVMSICRVGAAGKEMTIDCNGVSQTTNLITTHPVFGTVRYNPSS